VAYGTIILIRVTASDKSAAVNAQTGFPSTPATPPWSNEFKGLLMSVLKVRWSAIIMITLESRSGTVTCDVL